MTDSTSIQKNAGNQLHARAEAYKQKHGCDYRTAIYAVTKADTALAKSYTSGSQPTRRYDEAPARQAMNELVADPEKTRRLAGAVLDHLAKEKIINIGPGVADPVDAYRRALADCKSKYPGLARAADSGFIADNDFTTLAMLIPSIAKEVEKGNYSKAERCSSCGETKVFCRAKKLAHRRNVSEESRDFERCILEAAQFGDSLDAIRCYY